MRSSVDLPQPLGPISAPKPPAGKLRVTNSSARIRLPRLSNHFRALSTFKSFGINHRHDSGVRQLLGRSVCRNDDMWFAKVRRLYVALDQTGLAIGIKDFVV